MTKEKARKAHLTNADVLDAVADAMTYYSLAASKAGLDDLCAVLGVDRLEKLEPPRELTRYDHHRLALRAMRSAARLAYDAEAITWNHAPEVYPDIVALTVRDAFRVLVTIAQLAECTDVEKLLADTFNMVSERVGSKLRVKP